jgi:hypothetical protein
MRSLQFEIYRRSKRITFRLVESSAADGPIGNLSKAGIFNLFCSLTMNLFGLLEHFSTLDLL